MLKSFLSALVSSMSLASGYKYCGDFTTFTKQSITNTANNGIYYSTEITSSAPSDFISKDRPITGTVKCGEFFCELKVGFEGNDGCPDNYFVDLGVIFNGCGPVTQLASDSVLNSYSASNVNSDFVSGPFSIQTADGAVYQQFLGCTSGKGCNLYGQMCSDMKSFESDYTKSNTFVYPSTTTKGSSKSKSVKTYTTTSCSGGSCRTNVVVSTSTAAVGADSEGSSSSSKSSSGAAAIPDISGTKLVFVVSIFFGAFVILFSAV